nr:immunoglobulin light chain junction region [Macaca mulatta]MOW15006.1 immunoglobulin light chain junction region [Macaca mulatta]MOW18182.1 immunoglobulin light chain junction region [Macaca mulatta]
DYYCSLYMAGGIFVF